MYFIDSSCSDSPLLQTSSVFARGQKETDVFTPSIYLQFILIFFFLQEQVDPIAHYDQVPIQTSHFTPFFSKGLFKEVLIPFVLKQHASALLFFTPSYFFKKIGDILVELHRNKITNISSQTVNVLGRHRKPKIWCLTCKMFCNLNHSEHSDLMPNF